MAGQKKDCVTCRTIRYFALALVPIIILYLSGAELTPLRGVMLTQLAGWISGLLFVLLIVWKAWDEYWRK
jgi:hypothetical protein